VSECPVSPLSGNGPGLGIRDSGFGTGGSSANRRSTRQRLYDS